ncbi:methyltransferase family protein [Vibrio sp. WJH972]
MHRLELKIVPVVLVLIAVGFIWALDWLLPTFRLMFPGQMICAAILFVAAGYLGLKGIWDFRQAKTTVHPHIPHEASTVVSNGIYQYSRNPMYLGLVCLLLVEGLVLKNWTMILVVWGFIAYLNRFQILPEERALEAKFGKEYLDYKEKVRRWI